MAVKLFTFERDFENKLKSLMEKMENKFEIIIQMKGNREEFKE